MIDKILRAHPSADPRLAIGLLKPTGASDASLLKRSLRITNQLSN